MDAKMPYYMAYPMPFSYDDERTERMDFEYMKSMYPETAKKILPYVEEECDRMEYENSMVYDQCPDKLQLRLMSRRVYDNVRKHERMFFGDEEDAGLSGLDGDQETGISGTDREREHGRDGRSKSPSLRDFIEVMLYQELYKRRCDHRRRCRRFY
ncbi:hypothetical protein [Mediterraneibacter glycyrrhizinilyticus]|uniref:hypothetical protein n=1 Tax=Mediterraneibacter glycyrrhizinilyticus TaxID=342942 RepID=UPI0025A38B11|nr:hypothetical protein [Mediterraneibacter glycyrrhizinilyticus]MDM8124049.1 hypothetical protein [Mediterraneibacter glycyrrhizinilyticus]